MLGIIRVLTHDDPRFIEEHGRLIGQEYGIESISRCIPDQRRGIFDAQSEAIAVPKIIDLGSALEAEGCDALFLSCAADPGLTALRQAVSIPVVGAGSAAAGIAGMLRRPVAVMGIGARAPAPFRALLGQDVPYARPRGVSNTTDLLSEAGREQALICADTLYKEGAEVIAFSCTGLSTIALADAIRSRLGKIAIDAVSAAGLFLSQLAPAAR
ncbi:aspartate/glutamate racemase family protein [Martelella alba]|uniref:Hydantoin racemase n=1 Tax=Martelella alba TaxID=2590451 RepID=A0ABY2SHQ7_9HYPH|nr:aspartate/glutamate racemase family protein [Martelella alba]TKI04880.1 hydantoin racemase [Martelella alba]